MYLKMARLAPPFIRHVDEWLDRIQISLGCERHLQVTRAPVANAGYIACVGQHRECGGGVYVQIKQQAIFAVEYDGGKVLQAFEGCIQPQLFANFVAVPLLHKSNKYPASKCRSASY